MPNFTPKEMAVFLRRCANGICDDSCPCCDEPTECDAALMRMGAEVLDSCGNRWISVAERYPDKELEAVHAAYGLLTVEVIVVIEGALIPTTLLWDGESFGDSCGEPYRVVKWMPMPGI